MIANLLKFKITNEIIKYVIVGVVNALITWIIYSGALYFLNLNYLLALTLAWLFSVVYSYTFNFIWVFKPETKLLFKRRFVKYIISQLVSYGINVGALFVSVSIFNQEALIAQLLIIIPLLGFNFAAAKYWSLKPAELAVN